MAKKKVSPFLKLLHDREYSLRSFGAKVGIDFTYLCHMSKGRRMPTLARAKKISTALGVTLEDLFRTLPKERARV